MSVGVCMRIVLFGGDGWIGQMLQGYLQDHEVIVPPGDVRVDDLARLRGYLDDICETTWVDRVVCTIGRTYGPNCNTVDYLEDHMHENVRDNLYAPVCLAMECNRRNIHFTYFGTGCIFNGNHDFDEKADGNFYGSSYATVKNYTDRLIRQMPNCLNIRFRLPISNDLSRRGFIGKIIGYTKIYSQPNTVSVLPSLLPYIPNMLERGLTGTYHLVNPGTISHNEILEMYREYVCPSHTWQLSTIEEQRQLLRCARSNTTLDSTKLISLYPNIPTAKDAIQSILKACGSLK